MKVISSLLTFSLVSLFFIGCKTSKFSSVNNFKKNVEIRLIRNATMQISYNGKNILTDPLLASKKTYNGYLFREELKNPTVDLPLSATDVLKNMNAILVSHTHIPAKEMPSPASDHFDQKAIELIDKSFPIFIQPFDEIGLNRVGFKNIKPISTELNWEGISIRRFSTKHVDIDALLPMVGETSGYVLSAKNYPTILWTGDGILTVELKNEIVKTKPDIIIVHAGGAQLPIDEKGNKATLLFNTEATIEIAKLIPNAKIIAVHLESLDHCPVTRNEILSKMRIENIKNIYVPKDGESLKF